jgi:tetratricopeptide (TPR) repeat protein
MSESEEDFHRKMARKCFNEAWDYLEKKNRNDSEERTMLHIAHASRYHWGFVGTPQNVAVSDWQISRIYASLNQPQLALQFAKSCLEACEKNSLSEVLHTAYEAIARAYAVSKDYGRAKDYLNQAREQLAKLQLDEEERKIYSDQIRETEQMIRAA